MRPSRKKLASIVLLALALAGCAGPDTGEVVDRDYTGPWVEFRSSCITHDKKTGACTNTVTTPVHHSEVCQLRLRKGDEEGWRDIPCVEYSNYKVGDYYPKDM